MSNDVEFTPSAWVKSGQDFQSTSSAVRSAISSVASSSTDAAACGAANGMATVDGAITLLLSILKGVMDEVAPGIAEGLDSEGGMMIQTGAAYAGTEADNEYLSGVSVGDL
ncbi:hypothetical protein [Aestuariimicrobium ganziense]|uniref:hypothetical protein n=1 Tax=Aestuariimicrobium ganziense TaxID=2773677 RepID=UPI001945644D|nr:hypothetical protein [Aestuariimicrobium ganziense]